MESFIEKLQKINTHHLLLLSIIFLPTVSFVLIVIFSSNGAPYLDHSLASDSLDTTISDETISETYISTYIAGAINKPGVYKLREGARVVDLLSASEGIDVNASYEYVLKNLNLAKTLHDEEKIYIPYEWEAQEYLPTNLSSLVTESTGAQESTSLGGKVSINSSNIDQLDTLPGIGSVYAKKIYDNKPYKNIEDLVNKTKISRSVITKLEGLISFD